MCVSSPSSPTEVYVRYLPVFCLSAYLLATLLARRIVAKVADWIRMLSWVGRGMGVLDWDSDRRREAAVLGVNLGRPIVTNGDFVP